MTVKEHYDTHLARFYSWMSKDFEKGSNEFRQLLQNNAILPSYPGTAMDLEAGHGIQSVAMAQLGFKVTAVDFNNHLLNELRRNAEGLPIEIINDDLKRVKQFANGEYDLVTCCGDTLSHLDHKREVEQLLVDISGILKPGGKALLSFRDYSMELLGDMRFIPVKSDDTRILTCVLDYEKEKVRVTDLLYEKTPTGWKQKVSSYFKVRLQTKEVIKILTANGLQIQQNHVDQGMTTIIGVKA